jgi:tubulin-specific chaperone D
MRYFQLYIRKSCVSGVHVVPRSTSFLFETLYNLCNVRGYKTVVKFFPHEVADMEPCVEMLHFQEGKDYWINCMLLLWLSIIVLVPFDLQTIDSKKEGDSYEILVKRIINICKEQLDKPGKIKDYSAVLLSKLLTRPDVIK